MDREQIGLDALVDIKMIAAERGLDPFARCSTIVSMAHSAIQQMTGDSDVE